MMKFGTCCICQSPRRVRNLIMLHRRGPVPGTGWGCFTCGLPSDGAIAVICDQCFDAGGDIEKRLTEVVYGYPADRKRIPFSELAPEPFDHDLTKHPDET